MKGDLGALPTGLGAHGSEVMYFGSFCFSSELGFLNCDDICMCCE